MAKTSSMFVVRLVAANGKDPLTGYYASVVDQDGTAYVLAESTDVKGLYYYDDLPHGLYDLYKDASADPEDTPAYKDSHLQNFYHGVADRMVAAMHLKRYIQKKVEITGTVASPQTITSGTAPLATPDEGGSYPTFSSVPAVEIMSPYQDCDVHIVTAPSLSSGNVTFTVAVSDIGIADNYYCDIIITSID